RVGVGYYPNSDFVHLDVRPAGKKSAYWVDYSAPGQRAIYRTPAGFTPSGEREETVVAEEEEEQPAHTVTVYQRPPVVYQKTPEPTRDPNESSIRVLSATLGGQEPRSGGVRPRISAIPPI